MNARSWFGAGFSGSFGGIQSDRFFKASSDALNRSRAPDKFLARQSSIPREYSHSIIPQTYESVAPAGMTIPSAAQDMDGELAIYNMERRAIRHVVWMGGETGISFREFARKYSPPLAKPHPRCEILFSHATFSVPYFICSNTIVKQKMILCAENFLRTGVAKVDFDQLLPIHCLACLTKFGS